MSRGSSGWRVGALVLALFALIAAGCGEKTGDDAESTATTAGDDGATSTTVSSNPLGEPNAAEGDPVTIGLMGTGADCANCSEGGALEQPAAEAAIAWANEYLGGIGGHPIELDVCDNQLDPAISVDCGNQMVSDDVAAVVMGADSTVTGWEVLHDAGIPAINASTTQTAMLEDADSTFILQGSEALTVEFPIGAAEEAGATKVSIIVIDTPAATDIYTDETLQEFEDAGLDVDIIPVAFGTLDMTPQAQQVVQSNPDGLVNIVGHDAFCIPAIQGLQAAGFTGTIATISYCVTDAMRDAIPGNVVEGMLLASDSALGDPNDPSTVQFKAVMDEYGNGAENLDSSSSANAIFEDIAALAIGTAGLEGDVTAASIIEAMKGMDNQLLPGSGGRQFRCNGNAAPATPSVCMNSGLSASLNAEGFPESYTVFNDEPIPD